MTGSTRGAGGWCGLLSEVSARVVESGERWSCGGLWFPTLPAENAGRMGQPMCLQKQILRFAYPNALVARRGPKLLRSG